MERRAPRTLRSSRAMMHAEEHDTIATVEVEASSCASICVLICRARRELSWAFCNEIDAHFSHQNVRSDLATTAAARPSSAPPLTHDTTRPRSRAIHVTWLSALRRSSFVGSLSKAHTHASGGHTAHSPLSRGGAQCASPASCGVSVDAGKLLRFAVVCVGDPRP